MVLRELLDATMLDLAHQIVRDGEGAQKRSDIERSPRTSTPAVRLGFDPRGTRPGAQSVRSGMLRSSIDVSRGRFLRCEP